MPPTNSQRLGRKRDATRDPDILNAALEVLAAKGFEGMTMDLVAEKASAGKATLYRRWPSKELLVLEAIAHMKRSQVDVEDLPDTGKLRGDLLALIKPQSMKENAWKLKVISGLAAMIGQHPEMAKAATAAVYEPWEQVYLKLIGRAVDRGEIKSTVDIKTLAQVIPSMMTFRSIVLQKPFDKAFLITLIDHVLLPALGNKK